MDGLQPVWLDEGDEDEEEHEENEDGNDDDRRGPPFIIKIIVFAHTHMAVGSMRRKDGIS